MHVYIIRNFTQFNAPRNSKNEGQKHPKSKPNPLKNPPKSRRGPVPDASRTKFGNELENDAAGLIESGGFGAPKTKAWSFLKGVQEPSKFHSFFYIILPRFYLLLGSQHGPPNRPKSNKNRCRDPSLSWNPLYIRFSSNFSTKTNTAQKRGMGFRLRISTIFMISGC